MVANNHQKLNESYPNRNVSNYCLITTSAKCIPCEDRESNNVEVSECLQYIDELTLVYSNSEHSNVEEKINNN